jgi:hypothetical protein
VYEEQDAQVTRRRVILPERPGGEMVIDPRTVAEGLPDEGVRYRLFGGEGSRGLTTLATRVADHQTEVVLERGAGASARVLAPIKRYQPDHRPVLRPLALVPLAMLFLSALGSWRLGARLRRIAPSRPDAPLPSGPAVVEGELAADADAPAGGLWLRRGRGRMAIFVEGAEVVRASDVRPRTQPRGDAVDVAEGAPAVATGLVEPGVLYRDVATLRARRGDLLLVGCSLAEARAWIARRTFGTVALLTFATSLVAALTFAR